MSDVNFEIYNLSQQIKTDISETEAPLDLERLLPKIPEISVTMTMPGLPGKDGANGVDGKDGVDGANGVDGLPGKDGSATINYASVGEVKEGIVADKVVSPATLSEVMNRTFYQNSPASVWTITHNMGRFPAITIVDSAGTVVGGDIRRVSDDIAEVTFACEFSGVAYLS